MIKVLLYTLSLITVAAYNITREEVGLILEGVMTGALKAEGFEDIVDCCHDVEQFGIDVYHSVKEFE